MHIRSALSSVHIGTERIHTHKISRNDHLMCVLNHAYICVSDRLQYPKAVKCPNEAAARPDCA